MTGRIGVKMGHMWEVKRATVNCWMISYASRNLHDLYVQSNSTMTRLLKQMKSNMTKNIIDIYFLIDDPLENRRSHIKKSKSAWDKLPL
jgi:hypothetical protein